MSHPSAMRCENCKKDITIEGTKLCPICDPDIDVIFVGAAKSKTPNLCEPCFAGHITSHDSEKMLTEILKQNGAWYTCPKDPSGRRLGPMVGYAGLDDQEKQYVGDEYINFAVIEERRALLRPFTDRIAEILHALGDSFDVVCGIPDGGKSIALLACPDNKRFVYPKKDEIRPTTPGTRRGDFNIIFSKHAVGYRERLVLIEDVFHNGTATRKTISAARRIGAHVVHIVTAINRSADINDTLEGIRLSSLVRHPLREFNQSDPDIRNEIARGNIVWDPKLEWPRLLSAMK